MYPAGFEPCAQILRPLRLTPVPSGDPLELLTNNTCTQHKIPKTYLSPPKFKFEQKADQNMKQFHAGCKSSLCADRNTVNVRQFREHARESSGVGAYIGGKRALAHNIHVCTNLVVPCSSVKDTLEDPGITHFQVLPKSSHKHTMASLWRRMNTPFRGTC